MTKPETQHTFKSSPRSIRQYPVAAIANIHHYRDGEVTFAMDPSSSLGGLVAVDISSVVVQMPALLVAYKYFLTLSYHSEESAARTAVRWWLSNAEGITQLRDSLSREALLQEDTQAGIWQAYPVPGEVLYPIEYVGNTPYDIRALRAIGRVELELGSRTRDITVVHRMPRTGASGESEILVLADIFDMQFPALVHAYKQWFGTDDERAIAGAVEWWLCNADELKNRAEVCASVGIPAAEVGPLIWQEFHATNVETDNQPDLPPLNDHAI
jgi:hypothetical protein